MCEGGMDVDLFTQALKRHPGALYCQTGIHNPTGQTMGRAARTQLAGLINQHGLPLVEDVC